MLAAGALVAVERADRDTVLRIRVARSRDQAVRTNAMVVAQVWRGGRDRQAGLAALLQGVEILPIDDALGRSTGLLLQDAGTADAIDGSLVLAARDGDVILTSDPAAIRHLLSVTRRVVTVIAC